MSHVALLSKTKYECVWDICLILLWDTWTSLKCQMVDLGVIKLFLLNLTLELVILYVRAWTKRFRGMAWSVGFYEVFWVARWDPYICSLYRSFSWLPKPIILLLFNSSKIQLPTKDTVKHFNVWHNFEMEIRFRWKSGENETWIR